MNEDGGTWLGHVWEHVAIELQNVAGIDVTFGKTRSVDDGPGEYTMVYEYKQREVGLEAGELGWRLILHLLPSEVQEKLDAEIEEDFDWEEERDSFIRFAQRKEFGPSTQSLVDAAEARGIPWIRLNEYSLVQFGHGKFQKRIQATVTSETKHIAVEIASDKEDTRNLLQDLGLPVPMQRLVRSESNAVRAAERIGYPVVVKPLNANHGRGVSIRLMDADQVRVAFGKAREHGTGRSVLVESFISGFDHRMLVVNGKLVAVAKRVPGHVVGDGKHTIEELVEVINSDPRRGVGHEAELRRRGLAEDHGAGGAQSRDRRTVGLGDRIFEDERAVARRQAGDVLDVLDQQRHAGEEARILAALDALVDRGGAFARALGVQRHQRVDLRRLDRGQRRLYCVG
ncbi:MAG: acetate--CoA ligase family protein [Chloroflexi bacterium]|nr:acetate--CoA ligase family protein [Chloroflexota bacterium]